MSETLRSGDPAARAAVALACLPDVGCVAFRKCVERFGSAAAAFEDECGVFDGPIAADVRDEALERADEILAATRVAGARLLILGEPDYPAPLLDLRDPPPLLFARGALACLARPAVAIVGTRQSSLSGDRAARRLAGALARAGGCVVSGMARGIDAAAHRAALDAGGATVAVLGGGVDVVYPAAHRTLYDEIVARGAVLSEAAPGTKALSGAFPRRNRIIAALSRLVIVVEAGDRSGALITSDHALELGRLVGAVPGPIDAAQCAGSNGLLRQGATFVGCEEDALLAVGLVGRAGNSRSAARVLGLPSGSGDSSGAGEAQDPVENAVLQAIRTGAADSLSVSRATGFEARRVAGALVTLELAGDIWTDHAGNLRLNR